MKKACVIGWPITHSRSPLIHQFWLNQYEIDGSYEKLAVEPDDLGHFLANLHNNGFVGCNVTVPHKETAIPHITHHDRRVQRIGALNTVYIRGNETCATTTDGEGFYQNLLEQQPTVKIENAAITIIGAGGAARAIVDRLQDLKPRSITIVNRNRERALNLQHDLPQSVHIASFDDLPKILPETELLVNTTTLGMTSHPPLEISLTELPAKATVSDIVYAPLETQLIIEAKNRGLKTVTGLGMLLHQAVVGFELWFGVRPEVTPELYKHVLANFG